MGAAIQTLHAEEWLHFNNEAVGDTGGVFYVPVIPCFLSYEDISFLPAASLKICLGSNTEFYLTKMGSVLVGGGSKANLILLRCFGFRTYSPSCHPSIG